MTVNELRKILDRHADRPDLQVVVWPPGSRIDLIGEVLLGLGEHPYILIEGNFRSREEIS